MGFLNRVTRLPSGEVVVESGPGCVSFVQEQAEKLAGVVAGPGPWNARRDEAIQCLGGLTDPALQEELFKAKAHEALAHALRRADTPPASRAQAARALSCLVGRSSVDTRAVLRTDPIGPALELLTSDNAECRCYAAKLCCGLASLFKRPEWSEHKAPGADEIVASFGGIVPALVRLLGPTRADPELAYEAGWHAAGALARIAASGVRGSSEANPRAVLAAGAVPPLTSLLDLRLYEKGAVDDAANCLSDLAHSSRAGARAVEAAGAAAKLEALRDAGHAVRKEPCCEHYDPIARTLEDLRLSR